jgi:hypothetical protein
MDKLENIKDLLNEKLKYVKEEYIKDDILSGRGVGLEILKIKKEVKVKKVKVLKYKNVVKKEMKKMKKESKMK